ncbi:hypothetical protein EOS93_06250 [Rhizobium sp. RMa-01]|uniref:hypothetical protein n=1 Tax=unclassified Rhizobium TaxID=2613769 RepID=UPI0008DB21E7|nr:MULTISPECIES: hypothetical protein [unclassified Rhizobium]OHV26916.1 hypothetical protein BBJ66_02640 [Rhizobium sp. RSm-3]RVU12262.1 hypothetical protein EOS93_06250 [Rhizobium sp. RMa-01]
MFLKDHERDGVYALLVRTIEAGQEHEKAAKDMADAQERLRIANEAITSIRAALRAFGFSNDADLWNNVGEALGMDRYAKAFDLAGVPRPAHLQGPLIEGSTSKETLGNVQSLPMEAVANETLSIREWIIQILKAEGDKGTKAADVKDFLSAIGLTGMHEKTVGMTLYRLSKEGVARRSGRMWYYLGSNTDDKDLAEGSARTTPPANIFE